MTNEEKNPLKIIEEANSRTLEYFNQTYVHNLELVQKLKTELFELEVQIETLEKTRELYSYPTDNRRGVFSPLSDSSDRIQTRGKQLASQIQDLGDAKERLEQRIATLEQEVAFYKEQVSLLSEADKCIHTVFLGKTSEASPHEESEEAIEFIVKEEPPATSPHPYLRLMLEDYDHYRCANRIDQQMRQELISNLNKLDVLKWLLHSDIGRASITLEELHQSQQNILDSLEQILDSLDYNIDTKQPIWDLVEKQINVYRQQHPECSIESSCDCTEHELNIPPVVTIRLIQMLREIFDNIFRHSNANQVTAKIFISSRLIDVYVNDNGVGIPEDYLERSAWSSGLHRLHQTIQELDGKLQINGDLITGTNVRFSFPIKKEME